MNENDYEQSLATKAFAMFRDWTKNAQKYYSNLDFTIIDESVLVQDLIKSIRSAKETLLKEEKKEDRALFGFNYGFMLGFINSNLNGHWVNEYIRKQSQAYKEFTAMKAIKHYLEFDELTTIRIEKIYGYLMNQEANLDNLDISLKPNNYQELSFLPKDLEQSRQVILALDNQMTKFVLEFYKEKNLELMESADNYFSESEIIFILQNTSL